MGRRPRDIVAVEHEGAEQLISTPSPAETDVARAPKVAVKACLGAGQREGFRRGVASKVMPAGGPLALEITSITGAKIRVR